MALQTKVGAENYFEGGGGGSNFTSKENAKLPKKRCSHKNTRQ